MSQMSVDDFEKTYGDPLPVNGYVLVEVVDKDPTRISKGGIIVNEEQLGNTSPYFLVLAISSDSKTENLEIGDIIQYTERNIVFFYGKNMKKLALLPSDKIAAIFKKGKNKKIPVKEDSKLILPQKSIIVDD